MEELKQALETLQVLTDKLEDGSEVTSRSIMLHCFKTILKHSHSLQQSTPLVSDEEIRERSLKETTNSQNPYLWFQNGAKWMRDKLTNNETGGGELAKN